MSHMGLIDLDNASKGVGATEIVKSSAEARADIGSSNRATDDRVAEIIPPKVYDGFQTIEKIGKTDLESADCMDIDKSLGIVEDSNQDQNQSSETEVVSEEDIRVAVEEALLTTANLSNKRLFLPFDTVKKNVLKILGDEVYDTLSRTTLKEKNIDFLTLYESLSEIKKNLDPRIGSSLDVEILLGSLQRRDIESLVKYKVKTIKKIKRIHALNFFKKESGSIKVYTDADSDDDNSYNNGSNKKDEIKDGDIIDDTFDNMANNKRIDSISDFDNNDAVPVLSMIEVRQKQTQQIYDNVPLFRDDDEAVEFDKIESYSSYKTAFARHLFGIVIFYDRVYTKEELYIIQNYQHAKVIIFHEEEFAYYKDSIEKEYFLIPYDRISLNDLAISDALTVIEKLLCSTLEKFLVYVNIEHNFYSSSKINILGPFGNDTTSGNNFENYNAFSIKPVSIVQFSALYIKKKKSILLNISNDALWNLKGVDINHIIIMIGMEEILFILNSFKKCLEDGLCYKNIKSVSVMLPTNKIYANKARHLLDEIGGMLFGDAGYDFHVLDFNYELVSDTRHVYIIVAKGCVTTLLLKRWTIDDKFGFDVFDESNVKINSSDHVFPGDIFSGIVDGTRTPFKTIIDIFKYIFLDKNDVVCDIGCGTGNILKYAYCITGVAPIGLELGSLDSVGSAIQMIYTNFLEENILMNDLNWPVKTLANFSSNSLACNCKNEICLEDCKNFLSGIFCNGKNCNNSCGNRSTENLVKIIDKKLVALADILPYTCLIKIYGKYRDEKELKEEWSICSDGIRFDITSRKLINCIIGEHSSANAIVIKRLKSFFIYSSADIAMNDNIIVSSNNFIELDMNNEVESMDSISIDSNAASIAGSEKRKDNKIDSIAGSVKKKRRVNVDYTDIDNDKVRNLGKFIIKESSTKSGKGLFPLPNHQYYSTEILARFNCQWKAGDISVLTELEKSYTVGFKIANVSGYFLPVLNNEGDNKNAGHLMNEEDDENLRNCVLKVVKISDNNFDAVVCLDEDVFWDKKSGHNEPEFCCSYNNPEYYGSWHEPEESEEEDELQDSDTDTYLFYPIEESSKDAICITLGDIRRLDPTNYLNDQLVDFKIKHMMNEVYNTRSQSVHAFNCLFFSKLTQEISVKKGYSLVQRWTKNVDIFQKEMVIIPINQSTHWSVLFILFPNLLFVDDNAGSDLNHENELGKSCNNSFSQETASISEDKSDCDVNKISQVPCILSFDSLSLHNSKKLVENIRTYLHLEYMDKKCEGESNCDQSRKDKIKHYIDNMQHIEMKNIPTQENGYDCGVYVCKYIDIMLRERLESTKELISVNFRPLFHNNNFTASDITRERNEIKTVLSLVKPQYDKEMVERSLKKGKKKIIITSDDDIE